MEVSGKGRKLSCAYLWSLEYTGVAAGVGDSHLRPTSKGCLRAVHVCMYACACMYLWCVSRAPVSLCFQESRTGKGDGRQVPVNCQGLDVLTHDATVVRLFWTTTSQIMIWRHFMNYERMALA